MSIAVNLFLLGNEIFFDIIDIYDIYEIDSMELAIRLFKIILFVQVLVSQHEEYDILEGRII